MFPGLTDVGSVSTRLQTALVVAAVRPEAEAMEAEADTAEGTVEDKVRFRLSEWPGISLTGLLGYGGGGGRGKLPTCTLW